jgi:hypothetical protein
MPADEPLIRIFDFFLTDVASELTIGRAAVNHCIRLLHAYRPTIATHL